MTHEPPQFTGQERLLLALAQQDLPDSATPFQDLALASGMTEDAVLALLTGLKDKGVIRRFGANIKHQKAGFSFNAMVVWKVAPEGADRAGALMAAHPMLSHCYYRPSPFPGPDPGPNGEIWPYTLYTMIHGRRAGEIEAVIADLCGRTGLADYLVLPSLKELKKTSMNYF